MTKLLDTLTLNAFISFGVIIGGTFIGSLGAVFTGQAPGYSMVELAGKLKIWALVAALGGTFDTFRAIEAGFLGLQVNTVVKQLLLILSSFLGAHGGYLLILQLAGGRIK
ncbi:MAG: sporulation protein [Firmicutes bacterium]|nr:sporulation protein [Bacillota bacterium]